MRKGIKVTMGALHLRHFFHPHKAWCGRPLKDVDWTTTVNKVTCRVCRRARERAIGKAS